ncbi:hypothetical protein BC830DRAFT_1095781 [Chytriomyces sp. MP71]|nr:hypothetical protein BC830DRAFT_1095781 [Chytriomyces sp. MP71]
MAIPVVDNGEDDAEWLETRECIVAARATASSWSLVFERLTTERFEPGSSSSMSPRETLLFATELLVSLVSSPLSSASDSEEEGEEREEEEEPEDSGELSHLAVRVSATLVLLSRVITVGRIQTLRPSVFVDSLVHALALPNLLALPRSLARLTRKATPTASDEIIVAADALASAFHLALLVVPTLLLNSARLADEECQKLCTLDARIRDLICSSVIAGCLAPTNNHPIPLLALTVRVNNVCSEYVDYFQLLNDLTNDSTPSFALVLPFVLQDTASKYQHEHPPIIQWIPLCTHSNYLFHASVPNLSLLLQPPTAPKPHYLPTAITYLTHFMNQPTSLYIHPHDLEIAPIAPVARLHASLLHTLATEPREALRNPIHRFSAFLRARIPSYAIGSRLVLAQMLTHNSLAVRAYGVGVYKDLVAARHRAATAPDLLLDPEVARVLFDTRGAVYASAAGYARGWMDTNDAGAGGEDAFLEVAAILAQVLNFAAYLRRFSRTQGITEHEAFFRALDSTFLVPVRLRIEGMLHARKHATELMKSRAEQCEVRKVDRISTFSFTLFRAKWPP